MKTAASWSYKLRGITSDFQQLFFVSSCKVFGWQINASLVMDASSCHDFSRCNVWMQFGERQMIRILFCLARSVTSMSLARITWNWLHLYRGKRVGTNWWWLRLASCCLGDMILKSMLPWEHTTICLSLRWADTCHVGTFLKGYRSFCRRQGQLYSAVLVQTGATNNSVTTLRICVSTMHLEGEISHSYAYHYLFPILATLLTFTPTIKPETEKSTGPT